MIKSFKELKKNLKKDINLLPKIKVALLSDTSSQFLAIAIRGKGIEYGYNIELFEADYNQVEGQILNFESELYKFNADYVVVFQSTHKLLLRYNHTSIENQTFFAENRLDFVKHICKIIQSRLIFFNFSEIEDDVFGSYANKVENSFVYQTRKINFELMKIARENKNFFICDISGIQNKFGRNLMFNSSIYLNTDMTLSLDIIPYVASRLTDIIFASEGKFKKCLIIDLDNTIWGGIIGDDGLNNIELGPGFGIGKAYTEIQQWIRKLKNRGIIIAICSKNNENTAKEVFEKHPNMELRLEDISVFIANWNNKADNIRKIQSILNIGFDSMVFLDDNPFERNIVRQNISDISVPELPADPGEYLEYLYSLNLFETVSFDIADENRTKQYQIDTRRTSFQENYTTYSDFLKSLNMESEVVYHQSNTFNIPRIAQLSQRSNQFNLRTIRYSESDIQNIYSNNSFQLFSFTLSDKFGDNGLICVIILEKKNNHNLFINTWIMSCRVLKRRMENFALNIIVKYAREHGYKKIIGEYIPTTKNEIVREHYINLGFSKLVEKGINLYSLDVNSYNELESDIKVKI